MTVRPKGNQFQADFTHKGVRHRASFSTFEEAERWELQATLDAKLGKEVKSPGGGVANKRTIGQLVEYVTAHHWASKGRKESHGGLSVAKPGRNALLFAQWCGPDLDVKTALSTAKVSEFVAHMQKDGKSGATVNRYLSAISVLVKYALQPSIGALAVRPILNWEREGKGRIRFFSEAEVKALGQHLRHTGHGDEAAFYEFLVDTGARFGEAVRVRWTDIRGDMVTFEDTKTTGLVAKRRTIPLTKRARAALAELKLRKGNLPGPFHDVNINRMTGLWKRLQTHLPWLGDATPHHTFRHTTASWLVQRGVSFYQVMEWMGHSSIKVTQRYAHLAPEHLRSVASVLEAAE